MLRPRILAPLCALAVTAALAIIIPITSASAATCTAPTWNAATAYTGGAQVSYNNHQYTAKWWSQGHQPDQYSGPDDEWRDNGSCSGGGGGTPPPPPPGGGGGNCNHPDWAAGRTYHAGDIVRYPNNGRYYKASHDNPGYDPTISTWYWDPFSCNGGGDPPPPPPGGGDPGGFVVSEAQFNQMFPGRNSFYTYSGLTSAMSAYSGFAKTGSDTVRKQEAAAFLANVSHETGGLVYIVEQNTGNYPHYCDASQPYGCPAGQAAYYGRGPIQLSWNFNYKAAGDALGIDLLRNPYLVERDAAVAWKTGLWYWMTQNGPGTMTPHNAMVGGAGFGETIRSINGSLECNGRNPAQVQSRIASYQRFTQVLGVPTGGNLSC